jgi:hypothetical protein
MELAIGLSLQVQPALSQLVERIVEEARNLGFIFLQKNPDDTLAAKGNAAGGSCAVGMLGR